MAEINAHSSQYKEDLNDVLDSIHTDLAALKATVDTLVAKLNLDAGITDTDYAASDALTTTVDE